MAALYFSVFHFVNSAMSLPGKLAGVHPSLHFSSRSAAEGPAAGDGLAKGGVGAGGLSAEDEVPV